MANGYVCVCCGWQESAHIHGGFGMDDEQRQAMLVPLDGYEVSHMDCEGYAPSSDELECEAREKARGGSHEGCH